MLFLPACHGANSAGDKPSLIQAAQSESVAPIASPEPSLIPEACATPAPSGVASAAPLVTAPEQKPSARLFDDSQAPSAKIEVSKPELSPVTAEGYALEVSLGPVSGQDQWPVYDLNGEGILDFDVFFHPLGAEIYSGGPTFYFSKSRYLFTRFNQHHITAAYDTREAEIFLKDGERTVVVGRYRKPVPGDEFWTWIHPTLCEGEYAGVCQVSIRYVLNENNQESYPYLVTVYLSLTGQDNVEPISTVETRRGWDVFNPFLKIN